MVSKLTTACAISTYHH